jgi:hypothetical protein
MTLKMNPAAAIGESPAWILVWAGFATAPFMKLPRQGLDVPSPGQACAARTGPPQQMAIIIVLPTKPMVTINMGETPMRRVKEPSKTVKEC